MDEQCIRLAKKLKWTYIPDAPSHMNRFITKADKVIHLHLLTVVEILEAFDA